MNTKYSIKGQIISVILTHLEMVFIFFAVWLMAISVTTSEIGSVIYSVAAIFFYSIMMYSVCYSQARNDKKSYSPLTPMKYKGILLCLGVLVISIMAIFGYIFVWRTQSDGESLVKLWAISINVFYMFWFSPFINFLSDKKGAISILGYVMMFVPTALSCFLGYLAGYKDFDISSKMKFLVYEKKK